MSPPELAPAWGQGAGGWVGGPSQAHPLLSKAHNKLSFKKAGENLRWTQREAENSKSFRKLNGEKKITLRSPDSLSVIVSDLKQQASAAGRTPFDRVNILLFPILMFFRFSTCK